MIKKMSLVLVMMAIALPALAAQPSAIEPRSLTWHIVSNKDMSDICRRHGLRPSCEGMAAWDDEFQMCVIWTRSPKSANDSRTWHIVHHELRHCQEGHWHEIGLVRSN